MRVVFRADAGTDMGIGHVMRCLTLADGLTARRHVCHFVCRERTGHLARQIEARGYPVTLLAKRRDSSDWLGTSEEQDANDTRKALGYAPIDWFVTDHYGIGEAWEAAFRKSGARMLSIDDLADRVHDCDLLLDQTLGRVATDYAGLIPSGAGLLLGASMALLRPRFAQLRQQSLERRARGVGRMLVSLGGADASNLTTRVIDAIDRCSWSEPVAVDVVLGGVNPWISEVKARAEQSPIAMRVLVDASDMAELMALADLAIGTAGTTSWERCCLGLPSILVIAAENQRRTAEALSGAGAATVLEASDHLVDDLVAEIARFSRDPSLLTDMSENAAMIVDGSGCDRVVDALEAMR